MPGAVSYTHLDVYKRQELAQSRAESNQMSLPLKGSDRQARWRFRVVRGGPFQIGSLDLPVRQDGSEPPARSGFNRFTAQGDKRRQFRIAQPQSAAGPIAVSYTHLRLAHRRADFTAGLAVLDPEFADPGIRMRKRKAAVRLWMLSLIHI